MLSIRASSGPSHVCPPHRALHLTMTQRSKMWDIPELVLLILDFLSRQDLVFVARVCRRLWEIATPLIWDSLTGTQHPTHLFNTFPQGLRESLMHGSIHRTDQVSGWTDY